MESNEEKLQQILANAENQLADFLEMGKAVAAKLDFSIESILDLEKILLQTGVTEDSDSDLFFDAWLYLGLTVERSKKGTWVISDADDETNGYPAIRYATVYNDLFCPITVVRNFLNMQQQGGIINEIHKN